MASLCSIMGWTNRASSRLDKRRGIKKSNDKENWLSKDNGYRDQFTTQYLEYGFEPTTSPLSPQPKPTVRRRSVR